MCAVLVFVQLVKRVYRINACVSALVGACVGSDVLRIGVPLLLALALTLSLPFGGGVVVSFLLR